MSCTDVYVLRQDTCTTGRLYIYPAQVHPHGGGGGPIGSPSRRGRRGIDPRRRDLWVDDDIEIALALLELT